MNTIFLVALGTLLLIPISCVGAESANPAIDSAMMTRLRESIMKLRASDTLQLQKENAFKFNRLLIEATKHLTAKPHVTTMFFTANGEMISPLADFRETVPKYAVVLDLAKTRLFEPFHVVIRGHETVQALTFDY